MIGIIDDWPGIGQFNLAFNAERLPGYIKLSVVCRVELEYNRPFGGPYDLDDQG